MGRKIIHYMTVSLLLVSLSGCGAFDGLFGGNRVTYDSVRFDTYQAVGTDPLDSNSGSSTDSSNGLPGGSQQTDRGLAGSPQTDGGVNGNRQQDSGGSDDEYNVRARIHQQCAVGEIDLIKLALSCDVSHNLILTYRDGENERVLQVVGALRQVGAIDDFIAKIKDLNLNFAATSGGGDVFLCIDGNGNGRCGDETLHNLNDFNDLLTVFQRSKQMGAAGRRNQQAEFEEGREQQDAVQPELALMTQQEICASEEVSQIRQGLVLYHMHHGRQTTEAGMNKSGLFIDQVVAAKVAGILRNLPEPEQPMQGAEFQAAGTGMERERLARLLEQARQLFGLNENGIQDFLARRNRVMQLAMAVENCRDVGRRTDGCFAQGTQIQLNEKYRLPVELLRVGDQVLLANGQRAGVVEIVKGPELEPMVNLRLASGQELSVTSQHPMWTERGLVKAEDLTLEDRLHTQSGYTQPLAFIDRQPTAQPVYNLRLMGLDEADHLLLANGVVSGDLYLQEQLSKGATPTIQWAGF